MIIIRIQKFNINPKDEFELQFILNNLNQSDMISEHIITNPNSDILNMISKIEKPEEKCINCQFYDSCNNVNKNYICNDYTPKKIEL